jgi:putative ABC transport system substrate-binding protein
MDRRAFIALMSGSIVAAPRAAQTQPPGKVWRIGYLANLAPPPDSRPPLPLRDGLKDLGYIEDKNVMYISRWGEAKSDRLPRLAEDLVRSSVDVIVTLGGPAAQAAKAATSTVPIVMAAVGDAVGVGLVPNLARPGGNLTGLTDATADLSGKRLQLLKEAVPNASRIAIVWNENDPSMTLRYREIERAANVLHVAVQPLAVRAPEDFANAFSAMTRQRPDALFLVSDALTTVNRKQVLEFATAHRIPAMYEFSFLVQDGGLISYGAKLDEMFRRTAFYVDRILKGGKPGDIPVEQPTRYYLFINLKSAKAIGLTIPQTLILQADQVIE